MSSFKVVHRDGSLAKKTKVSISVNGGGVVSGFTDDRGFVSLLTSGSYGKIIVNGRTIHQGSLNINEVRI